MKPLGTKAVAEACGVSVQLVCRWIDSGKLKGYRVPGSTHRRVLVADLCEFMLANELDILLPNLEKYK